jgi:hypothetical protein
LTLNDEIKRSTISRCRLLRIFVEQLHGKWYSQMYSPFLAYVYAATAMRTKFRISNLRDMLAFGAKKNILRTGLGTKAACSAFFLIYDRWHKLIPFLLVRFIFLFSKPTLLPP